MVGCQFQFLSRDMYHQIDWFTVGIFLASLLVIKEVTNALRVKNVRWQTIEEQLQQKSKQLLAQANQIFQARGKQVIEQVASNAQEAASELTTEAIIAAVDRAINVIQIASQEVRERQIPTKNVSLEVSVKIMGAVELKMKADVAQEGQVSKVIEDNHTLSPSPCQDKP